MEPTRPRIRRTGLLVIALIHLAMAAWIMDPAAVRPFDPDRAILWEGMPPPVRATLWAAAGLLVLAGAVRVEWETAAYAVAVVMPLERAIGHLWSWGQWWVPGTPGGHAFGWAAALVWIGFAQLIGLMGSASHGGHPPAAAPVGDPDGR